MGDFYGFQYMGIHCSELGLVRVSDGSRYTEDLLPTFTDSVQIVPGGDGTYYWDSFYNQKNFTIQVATDHMTETQFRRMRQVFNGRDGGELIFDERPYKVYNAKISNSPQLNFICFEENGQRVYKGEGTLSFACYYPFAHAKYKYQSSYPSDANVSEWAESAGLPATQGALDSTGVSQVFLCNPGDLKTPLKIFFAIPSNWNYTLECKLKKNDVDAGSLKFNNIAPASGDAMICINTKTHLVEGYNASYKRTGTLYNKYIVSGDFVDLPQCVPTDYYSVTCAPTSGQDVYTINKVEYDYLYY